MNVLDIVLNEEYDRLLKRIKIIQEEINSLPKGYISKKEIKSHCYYYLQYREKNRVISKYIKKAEVKDYNILINERKALEIDLKELLKNKRKLERVLS